MHLRPWQQQDILSWGAHLCTDASHVRAFYFREDLNILDG